MDLTLLLDSCPVIRQLWYIRTIVPTTSPAQVLDRLAESYPDLSPQVRHAARRLLDQPGRVAVLSMRQLAEEAGDYIVASRNLGWLVVTFTMFASVLSGVGMAGLPGTVYTFGAPFMVSILAGNSIAAMLMWYVGPRIWVLGKHYHFTTPGDLLGEYYQSDTIRLYTVFASLLYNLVYIVAQLLAGGILLNVLSGNTLSPALGSIIIAVIVVVHVVSSGLRGIAWLDLFNGLYFHSSGQPKSQLESSPMYSFGHDSSDNTLAR